MFCSVVTFLCVWPSMVLNQRQVSVIVSDWEPYLGSLFSIVFCGWLYPVLVFSPDGTVLVVCTFVILFSVLLI
jgi:hypothetical protein